MNTEKNIYSRKLLLVISLVYFLNYLMDNRLSKLFSLDSSVLLGNSEVWRLFTFPLAFGSLEGFLLFAFTFYFIAPRLETRLRQGILLMILPPVVFLQGIVHTIIFWNYSIPMTGFEGASFLILTLFTLIEPNQRIKFWVMPTYKMIYLSLAVIIIWASVKFYLSFYQGNVIMLQAASAAGYGVIAAVVVFVKLLLLRKLLGRRNYPRKDEISNIRNESDSIPVLSEAVAESYQRKQIRSIFEDIDDIELNEQNLNLILDKIIEHGKDSLSYQEIKFLEKYSNKI